MASRISESDDPVPAEQLSEECVEELVENAQRQDRADEADAWDRVHEHQKQAHGESKADQVFRALRRETRTIELDGEVETADGPVEIDVDVEVRRVPLQGLLDFIGDWSKLQELEEIEDDDVSRITIDGKNPKAFANDLAEDAYEHVDNLVVDPDTGFNSQRLRREAYGLEVAADVIMTAADAFGAEVDDAGNSDARRKAKRSRSS